jgi:hypothetical protein
LLDVSAQDDACPWIYQMGACARSADDGLIRVGIHGHIVGEKALKAHVRAAVEEKRHNDQKISVALVASVDLAQGRRHAPRRNI